MCTAYGLHSGIMFLEKTELAHDFITYITTTSLYTKNIQPSGDIKQEYTCNIYKAGMCASAMCFCLDIPSMIYICSWTVFSKARKGVIKCLYLGVN